ncbi:metal ABC transporter ATP-binding protein [Cohnella caldifontis]|uniref:metal ABC transporter ATP-binding protein n=1 Tax=Cohnella caldifontis TaxID=3027471 RepID=UPI0023EBA2AA|nr:ABC transporter ATP-binding protein [Cohnella sp. YIM B05605]
MTAVQTVPAITETQLNCHPEIIALDRVSFSFGNKPVLSDLSFRIRERDFVGLIGPNGAGKSTLLRLIVGLLKPDAGSIELFGKPADRFKDRHFIGYVPQRSNFNPLFPATVREVVLSGLYGRKKLFRGLSREDQARCDDALRAMHIEDLGDKRIGALSGGQQQRVFLARALISGPKLLILDEPMSGVDAETQANFFHLIRHLHQKHVITFLMVSHDMEMVRSYLGREPKETAGKLSFYVRHSHETEDCAETDLLHTIRKEG